MSAALTATDLVLAREQKLHALDGLAAAAAHELGTPLSTIALVTKELEHALPADSPLREDIALLRTQALRCREILQKLTRSPSEQDPLHARVSVRAMLEEAAEPYRSGRHRHLDHARGRRPSTTGPPAARSRRRAPAGRHLRARQYHRECHRLRQARVEISGRMERVGARRHASPTTVLGSPPR